MNNAVVRDASAQPEKESFMTTDLQEPATSTADAVKFSMRNLPLLDSGATMGCLGIAPALWAHSKVYSTGGENKLHSHDIEDHCFLVLQGEATFDFGDGSSMIVHPFEGVMLPRGTEYRFTANPVGNLVIFRVGGGTVANSKDVDPRYGMPREALQSRKRGDGTIGDAGQGGAHSKPTVFTAGAFFAPD
jgi:mannose-6-phosphate isomerase-like protein (cupin superfamily)